MAVKTITIDLDAYEALARRKQPGQSFSDVIKQQFAGESTGRELLAAVKRLRFADDVLDAVEAQVRARRQSRARVPKW